MVSEPTYRKHLSNLDEAATIPNEGRKEEDKSVTDTVAAVK